MSIVNSKAADQRDSGLVCGRATGRREKGWVFLCELVGLRGCAAVHTQVSETICMSVTFMVRFTLVLFPVVAGVLAAVAVAVGSCGRGAGSRGDVGHGSGYPNVCPMCDFRS